MNNKPTIKATLKFFFMSLIGILYFFVPLVPSGEGKSVLLVYSVNIIKSALSPWLSALVMISIGSLILLCITARLTDKFPTLTHLYGSVKTYSIVLYLIGFILSGMTILQIGPEYLIGPAVGGQGLGLAKTVLVTIVVAGLMVPFITEFGLLEYIGVLIEPFMRPVFKVPGYAAIDAVTSFVANPTLGIFFTNKLYKEKKYTTREAASISTNFSFISLGFFAVLTATANITEHYGKVLIASFLLSFVMAAIVIRLFPLRGMPDTFIDGTERESEEHRKFSLSLFRHGYETALKKAEDTPVSSVFAKALLEVLVFAQKISAYIMAISSITFLLVEYTSLFNILGIPFIPVLKLCQVPNAAEIAPAMILGLAEIAIPATFISTLSISVEAAFFVIVVSALQIIMFSNSAVSIMESEIPLGIGKLILIFFIRTLIAIPIVSIVMHILF